MIRVLVVDDHPLFRDGVVAALLTADDVEVVGEAGDVAGAVALAASDAAPGEPTLHLEGVLFSLLGAAEPATLEAWFAALGDGGSAIDPLQLRPWGDHDGQVTDRFGVRWLIGYRG